MLRERANGILDFIGNGASQLFPNQRLLTPPNATTVFPGSTPLQEAMNRPEVHVLKNMLGETSVGTIQNPRLDRLNVDKKTGEVPMAMASPTQEVDQAFNLQSKRLANQAAKAVEIEKKRPEIAGTVEFQNTIKEFFGDRENMLRLAAGFNTMRLQPDTGLTSIIGSELKDISAKKALKQSGNRTADVLEKFNPDLAEAVRNGMDPSLAIQLYKAQKKDFRGVVVGNKILDPVTGKVLYDANDGDPEQTTAFRTLEARAAAAGLERGTRSYMDFMFAGGSISGLKLKINKDGTVELATGTQSLGKKSEAQSNAVNFGARMLQAGKVLNKVEEQGIDLFQGLVSQIPIAGNYAVSSDYQRYQQAKGNFINAILRKESGAAIAATEFAAAEKQYFPQPGDDDAVISQKRENRELATQILIAGAAVPGVGKDIRVIFTNITKNIKKPDKLRQDLWDEMTDQEKFLFLVKK